MKTKTIVLSCLLVAAASTGWAGTYSDFAKNIGADILKPFARDLGGVLGATGWSTAKPLGFPGFSVKGVVVVQTKPGTEDMVLRNAGVTTFGLPVAEVAVGLPWKFDVVAHGFGVGGLTVAGGGLRWCAFESGLKTMVIPSVGVSAFGDIVDFSAFKATHMGLNAVASWEVPFVTPYVGVGYDATNVKVRAATVVNATTGLTVDNAFVIGLSGTANGERFIAGAELKAIPFVRVNGGVMMLHGVSGYFASAGIRF
ncbi:MAG: hypothetical protein HY927_05235 [Elusimicrobia bacterium]|nr:hypothetical protein [Elusimicrobiota bacterium]